MNLLSPEGLKNLRGEFKGLTPAVVPAAILLTATSLAHVIRHRTIFDGSRFPESGAFIVSGNHFATSDTLKGHLAAVSSGRLVRPFLKRSLVKKGVVESDEYLARLGETREGAIREYSPIKSFVLRNMGVIDLLRDGTETAPLTRGIQELENGHGLSILLQAHRYTECILTNLEKGAASFAIEFPDTPVYLMAFSGPPHGPDKMTIIKPFTYNQLVEETGREFTVGELTVVMADKTATGLPEASQQDWETRRASELLRLNPSRRPTSVSH